MHILKLDIDHLYVENPRRSRLPYSFQKLLLIEHDIVYEESLQEFVSKSLNTIKDLFLLNYFFFGQDDVIIKSTHEFVVLVVALVVVLLEVSNNELYHALQNYLNSGVIDSNLSLAE